MIADNTAAESPFLAERAEDDVAWHFWSDKTVAVAKTQAKPLLLFIGYQGCPWTRKMADACFRRADIAGVIAEDFFPIVVDAQVHPDVDQAYQAGAQALGLEGGWPLLAFCTPGGLPFWGATYMAPQGKDSQPGLSDILSHLSAAFRDSQHDVTGNAELAKAHVADRFAQPAAGPFDPEVLDQIAPTFMARMDLEHGGITGAPKFPNTPYFERLWRAYLRTGKADYAAAVQLTYTKLCNGALYDHIGGGFFRYSLDGPWTQPDLEKTLYDNALILKALCHLHGNVPQPLYAARIRNTADFIANDLGMEDHRLAAGLAAPDDPSVYHLDQDAIQRRIAAPFTQENIAAFCRAYGIGAGPIPTRQESEETPSPKEALLFEAIALELRSKRPTADLRNELIVTSWSMHAVIGLSHAAKLLQDPHLLEKAERSFQAMIGRLEDIDALPRTRWGEKSGPAAGLDDIAASGLAAITLACALDKSGYLVIAQALGDHLLDRFSHSSGAFCFSQTDTPLGPILPVMDQPVPSGNAVAIRFLSQLSRMTSAPRYSDAALKALTALGGEIHNNFMGLGSFLAAGEDVDDPIDIGWSPADFDAETIAWAVAPPGALIIPPALQEGHSAAPIRGASSTAGLVLCRNDIESTALTQRDAAIDALRNAKRVAKDDGGGMVA
ncbi:MAG: DUF255 domain-containing protein [Pseudomonadota bacterium]